MYVCMYVCMYVYVYIYICIHAHMLLCFIEGVPKVHLT